MVKGAQRTQPEPNSEWTHSTVTVLRRLRCVLTGSLAAQVSATDSSEYTSSIASLSRLQQESIDRLAALEKLFQEWRARPLPTIGENLATVGQTDRAIEAFSPDNHVLEYITGTQLETDGRVQLTGGTVSGMVADPGRGRSSVGGGSTLPPAYSSRRGEE